MIIICDFVIFRRTLRFATVGATNNKDRKGASSDIFLRRFSQYRLVMRVVTAVLLAAYIELVFALVIKLFSQGVVSYPTAF